MENKILRMIACFALISLTQACSIKKPTKKVNSPTSLPADSPANVEQKSQEALNAPQNEAAPSTKTPIAPKTESTNAPVILKNPVATSESASISEAEINLEKARVYLITKTPGNELMEAFGHADIEWDTDGDIKTTNTVLSFSPNIDALNKALSQQWKTLNAKTLTELSTDEVAAKKLQSQAKKEFTQTLSSIMKQDSAMAVLFFESEKYFKRSFENARNRKISRDEMILSVAQKSRILTLLPTLAKPFAQPALIPLPKLRYKNTEFNCSSALRDLILSQAESGTPKVSETAWIGAIEAFFLKSKTGIAQTSPETQKELSGSMPASWKDLLEKSISIAIQDSGKPLLVSRPESLGMKPTDPYYEFVVTQMSYPTFTAFEKALLDGDLVSRFLNLISLGSQGAVVFNDSQIKLLQESAQSLATDPSLKQIPNRYDSMVLPVYLKAELEKLINPETHQAFLKCVTKSEQPDPRFVECKN